ncbi:MAG: hypothetical protein PSX36_12195 [bacterium]|nr:hypothetical protein [bacterium]
MLATFLIIIATLITGVTIYLLTQSQRKSAKNSPFTDQFDQLVHLLIQKRKFDIQKVKSNSMLIRIHLNRDAHYFDLLYNDGRLNVHWKLQSDTLGKREKDWSFNAAENQSKIYEEILTDIRNYLKKIRSERNYLDQSFLSAV